MKYNTNKVFEAVKMETLYTVKIRKAGNNSVVTLPIGLLDKLNVKNNDNLDFIEHEGKIYIQSAATRSENFNAILEQLTNEHDDVFKKLSDV